MSNFLAVATVTETIRQMLQPGKDVPGATVTTQRPDAAGGAQGLRVNLYLYQVTPNAALRNDDLPNRRTGGELVKHPKVALNLHYLLTFYGDEGNLEPQRLLGSVVRTLHARPVLTHQMIRNTIANAGQNLGLANSNLADQVELIKLTPISLSTEELSKLWSVFFQTPYNLSIAYQGTVVLIESEESTQKALPVRGRNLYVVQFRQSVIEQVLSQAGMNLPIIAGSTLVIRGKQLRGDVTRVRAGGIDIIPGDVTDMEISLQLPPGLQAGVQGVQVVHQMLMGTPPVPHLEVESNVAAFVLHPIIKKDANGNYEISISNIQTDVGNMKKAKITVKLDPKVGKQQRVVIFLNDLQSASVPLKAYSFNTEPRNAETDTIEFQINRVEPGDYLVRVQVDGAESLLDVDANTGKYIGPKVTVP
ncbi:MAG: DUF4255 domain-containing protein [Candidatus Methanoperedens sp.]|nr:DUF4255 domain-containing protein [Candidatus Methanoperedens sp.]